MNGWSPGKLRSSSARYWLQSASSSPVATGSACRHHSSRRLSTDSRPIVRRFEFAVGTGVKSLNQRRDDAFGFSGERIGLGHRGLLFMLVERSSDLFIVHAELTQRR